VFLPVGPPMRAKPCARDIIGGRRRLPIIIASRQDAACNAPRPSY
jgi:hypothetical protein